MDQSTKLRLFAQDLKEGYQLVKEKRDVEAIKKLKPFVELMRKSETPNLRLFTSYCIASLRIGEFEEFLRAYGEVKEIDPKTKEEEEQKYKVEVLFQNVMDEMQKHDDH